MKKAALVVLSAVVCLPEPAVAQGAVDPEHGLVAVAQLLRGLGSVKRVLVIGAHPDDEDTGLLAVLVRGLGADAAYLALNRGEGGQNLIGPESGIGLGLLRTEELLAARRLDGASQFFSRAYDFGYSKSAEETFRFWPRDSVLADVVYVVRKFRPQIIVSIFTGTRRDGHGQHQVAGILAREAFDVAGDPREPKPWTPLKLYRSTRFDTASTTLAVETGRFDLLFGRSYHQIAMASRSQHRSQDMGRIESLGPRRTSLQLLESRVAAGHAGSETSLFDGVDTTLVGSLGAMPPGESRRALVERLAEYGAHLRSAREALAQVPPANLVSHLSLALATLRRTRDLAAIAGPRAGTLRFALGEDDRKLESALTEAAGVIVDAFSSDDLVVPGQSFEVEVQIWNGGDTGVDLRDLSLRTPAGWRVEPLEPGDAALAPGTLTRRRFSITVPGDAEYTRPYFLRAPRAGAVYAWPADTSVRARPFSAPLVEAQVGLTIAGQAVQRRAEAVYRFADQAAGEVRRPLYVVPAVGVDVAPTTAVWPLGQTGGLTLSVRLEGESPAGSRGRVWLELPAGWMVRPVEAAFELAGPGRATTVDFQVSAAPQVEAGPYEVRAVAQTADGRRYGLGYTIIDYPHIHRNILFEDAVTRIEAFELEAERELRVAYVPGAGDAVADAIVAMGLSVDVLDDRAVAAGDLSGYEVIVLGIRAYETNATLVASNDRLLEWVRAGGTLIVQYQQYGYFDGGYAPYPLSVRRPHDRVSDEGAAIEVLLPDHPAFKRPNEIGPRDFDGWVQERGLYFASEWDDRYQALLETADPGERAKRGGLLVARYGDGLYVYTGLSLFRQLPAGVPGAYRLLANLLSLRG
jgi:LmbE family N-acetylglucosaminyl deacetylase